MKLRGRVETIAILTPTETASALGGVDTTFAKLTDAPAGVMEDASRDFVGGGGVQEQKRAAFNIVWMSAVAALGTRVRVGWNGMLFECVGMTGTRQSGALWLQCKSIGVYSG